MEDVHGVDDHGGVGGVLAGGVTVLLDGGDGVFEQHSLPTAKVGLRPVAVDALDGGGAVFGYLVEHFPDVRGRHIVGVEQYGQFEFFYFLCHKILLLVMMGCQ